MNQDQDKATRDMNDKRIRDDKTKVLNTICSRHRKTQDMVKKLYGHDPQPMLIDKG